MPGKDLVTSLFGNFKVGRQVRVHDPYLGVAFALAVFVIVLYIFLYEGLYHLGYCKKCDVEALDLQLSIKTPARAGNRTRFPKHRSRISDLQYCCSQNCTPSNYSVQLKEGCTCASAPRARHPCVYANARHLAKKTETYLMVYTYAREELQTKAARDVGPPFGQGMSAYNWSESGHSSFYFADVESYIVLLDHSIAKTFCDKAYKAQTIAAKLKVKGRGAMQHELCQSEGKDDVSGKPALSSPCVIPVDKELSRLGRDVFTVGQLLRAAGVALGMPSPSSPKVRTLRERGLSLRLSIHYSNFKPWTFPGSVSYHYSVEVVHHRSVWTRGNNHYVSEDARYVRFLFGVKFNVVLRGQLARFNILETCLRLASFLSLLTATRWFLKTVASKCGNARRYQSTVIVDEAPAFDYLGVLELQRMPAEHLDALLQERALPCGGNQYQRAIRLYLDSWTPAGSAPEVGRTS